MFATTEIDWIMCISLPTIYHPLHTDVFDSTGFEMHLLHRPHEVQSSIQIHFSQRIWLSLNLFREFLFQRHLPGSHDWFTVLDACEYVARSCYTISQLFPLQEWK